MEIVKISLFIFFIITSNITIIFDYFVYVEFVKVPYILNILNIAQIEVVFAIPQPICFKRMRVLYRPLIAWLFSFQILMEFVGACGKSGSGSFGMFD